jgi:aminoglycoside phosphotransferase (APT) family kinase protein
VPQWDADLEVGEDLVRALVAEQFPELDASSARLLGEGWDNAVWIVEERWAFRFPRRAVAIPGVERELAVLPLLAPLLPSPVPVPVHVGSASKRYPWPFFSCEVLPGHEPSDVDLSDVDRVELGGAVGRFLLALHAPATRAAVDPGRSLPVDPNRRADMPSRVELARKGFADLQRLGLRDGSEDVEAVLGAAVELPGLRIEDVVVVHGDLHQRHVLVDESGLAGVIDWGDVCVSDASIDLVLVWSLLPPAGRERFLEAYGPVDESRRLRARVLALQLCSMLAVYAHDVGYVGLERECLAGIERTLIDWGSG